MAAAVAAAVLVLARPQDSPPEAPPPAAPLATPSATSADRLALDTQDCLKTTETVQELSQAVAAAGGAKGLSVVSAADRAEIRMGRRLSTRNEQLHAVFSDLKDAVALLREAARTGNGGDAAIDRVLKLIDTLDARCQIALAATGSGPAHPLSSG